MTFLGQQPDTVFLGQTVIDEGTGMNKSLINVPLEKKIEMPVAESFQGGLSLGLALNGSRVVSCFPRFDFLILSTNEIVNHINRIKEYSNSEYQPSLIIRTAIGSRYPLDPQAQHRNSYTEAFKLMCDNIDVIELKESAQIFPEYEHAYNRNDGRSTLLIEYADLYNY